MKHFSDAYIHFIYMSHIMMNLFCYPYIMNHIVSSSTIITPLNEKCSKQCPGWTGPQEVSRSISCSQHVQLWGQTRLLKAVSKTASLSGQSVMQLGCPQEGPHFPCSWPEYLSLQFLPLTFSLLLFPVVFVTRRLFQLSAPKDRELLQAVLCWLCLE